MPYSNEQENVGALGTDIDVSEISAATIVTESETITSNDNDTTIPTSAAVKNYADAESASLTNKDISDSTNTYRSASATVTGAVELATSAETTTGTDTGRVLTPDGLRGSDYGKKTLGMVFLDNTTDNATGDGQGDIYFVIPEEYNGWNIVNVATAVLTAGTTGTQDIQLHNLDYSGGASDILSTKITIDSGETSSYTAATPAVIDTDKDDVVSGDRIRVDTDAIHSGTAAKGLVVWITLQKPGA